MRHALRTRGQLPNRFLVLRCDRRCSHQELPPNGAAMHAGLGSAQLVEDIDTLTHDLSLIHI